MVSPLGWRIPDERNLWKSLLGVKEMLGHIARLGEDSDSLDGEQQAQLDCSLLEQGEIGLMRHLHFIEFHR